MAQSERLGLFKMRPEDAAGFYLLNSDPQVMQFTGDKPFASVAEANQFIQSYQHYKNHGYGRWSIYLRESEDYIGFCGLRFNQSSGDVDLGMRIIREHWRQGYAEEASRLALAIGFDKYRLNAIIGRARVENEGSIALLKKLGFRYQKSLLEAGLCWDQFKLTSPTAG